jgi:hypothetical protein
MTSDTYKPTVLDEIYTSQIMGEIAERSQSNAELACLHRILTSNNEYHRITRVHLDKCLRFVKEHNGIDADRLQRLTRPQDFAVWKSVHNELLVPYFFSKVFHLNVGFIVSPNKKGLGDFRINHPEGDVYVEVKTPKGDYRDTQDPQQIGHSGLG